VLQGNITLHCFKPPPLLSPK